MNTQVEADWNGNEWMTDSSVLLGTFCNIKDAIRQTRALNIPVGLKMRSTMWRDICGVKSANLLASTKEKDEKGAWSCQMGELLSLRDRLLETRWLPIEGYPFDVILDDALPVHRVLDKEDPWKTVLLSEVQFVNTRTGETVGRLTNVRTR